MQTVPIEVVNTQADWFTPFSILQPAVQHMVQSFLERKEEYLPLKRYLRHQEDPNPYVVHVTDWRRHFNLDLITFHHVDAIEKGRLEYTSLGEISLFYGDKHGTDSPDFMGWHPAGNKGVSLTKKGIFVSEQELSDILMNVETIPETSRALREPRMVLYVEKESVTPAPIEPPREERPIAYIENGCLEVEYEGLLLPKPINVRDLYTAMNKAYQNMAHLPKKVEQYPLLPPSIIMKELKKQGYDVALDRKYAVNQLVRMGFLERIGLMDHPEGFRPTDSGVRTWNVMNWHI